MINIKRQRRKEDPDTPDLRPPAWRQPPAKKRSKMRSNQAAVPIIDVSAAGKAWLGRLPRIHVQVHLTLRQWIALPLLAVLIFGMVELFNNDLFFVYAAQINGAGRVPADQIYAAANIDGHNIFWLRGTEISRRVAQVNGVAAAQAHVRLPNQVIIDVQERTPLAVWRSQGQDIWFATDGKEMPALGTPPALMLEDETAGALEPAQKAEAKSDTQAPSRILRPEVLAGLKVLAQVRPDLTQLAYGSEEGLYFKAAEGWTVYLGTDGDMAQKLALLASVQPVIKGRATPPKQVDLRFEGRAFYR